MRLGWWAQKIAVFADVQYTEWGHPITMWKRRGGWGQQKVHGWVT